MSVAKSVTDLSFKEARQLILTSQGLHKNNAFGKGLQAVARAVQQLSYVQIDTISVVERAHHHTLWNRVSHYQPAMLDALLEQKQLFEYWSHAAAYLPMQDYRFSLQRKLAIAGGEKHWHDKDHVLTRQILERIRQEGPLQAKDFEHVAKTTGSGWWNWKPAKKALEQLFMEGELMVVKRQGFQKVYDITERVLPSDINTQQPTEDEFCRYLIERFLQANGLATAAEMAYLRKGMKAAIVAACQQMLEDRQLQRVSCQGQEYFVLAAALEIPLAKVKRSQVKILSPFDNLLIQRKRTRELFDFDYQIECYVPDGKRQYGYFTLPILWGTQFAARMDAKIERKTAQLQINHLAFETPQIDTFVAHFKPALQAFLQFNQGCTVKLQQLSSSTALKPGQADEIRTLLEAVVV